MLATGLVLTDATLRALHFIYQYRYLTVMQVTAVTGLHPKSTSGMLLRLEREKLVGSFGNIGIRGYGKTPKVYFLTKAGHAILRDEGAFLGFDVGDYKPINITSRWSPQMYHRLATLDVLLSLERACLGLADYVLPATFVEYRRGKVKGGWVGETTDFVSDVHTSENRIVPDAGFVLENQASRQRALFLIEVDRGTELHVTQIRAEVPKSFRNKIEQYDRYLKGGAFKARYAPWGQFSHFVLLVITEGAGRVEHMRQTLSDLPREYHQFYRFSTQDAVVANFFHGQWKGRSASDQENYQLIKGRTAA